MPKYDLPHETLCEKYDYLPLFGVFVNKKTGNVVGQGKYRANNYTYIKIRPYGFFLTHILAWFWFYKEWPKNQVDHKNFLKWDNRICNLRDFTSAQNADYRRTFPRLEWDYSKVPSHRYRRSDEPYLTGGLFS